MTSVSCMQGLGINFLCTPPSARVSQLPRLSSAKTRAGVVNGVFPYCFTLNAPGRSASSSHTSLPSAVTVSLPLTSEFRGEWHHGPLHACQPRINLPSVSLASSPSSIHLLNFNTLDLRVNHQQITFKVYTKYFHEKYLPYLKLGSPMTLLLRSYLSNPEK